MLMTAPNIQLCASHVLTGMEAISAPNGGSVRFALARSDHAG